MSTDSPRKVVNVEIDEDLCVLLVEYARKRAKIEGGSRSSKINDFLRRHEAELKEVVER